MNAPAAAAALAALALVVPATASAKPAVCQRAALEAELVDGGQLDADHIANGERVNLIRCGDVTDDGNTDALFAVTSGGTAGNTRFGVIEGREDASPGALVLYKRGYKVGLARRDRRSFEVLQPHYAAADPNCCPSSFRLTRYRWFGNGFSAGKAKKLKNAPRRFYRP
ncbi:MAG: hypothetical protein HOQ03_13775 [Thermoleophilia bacterium]|nr:hypothetical protein [Thermoleophilia bacterium]